jgi:hypothetical protein
VSRVWPEVRPGSRLACPWRAGAISGARRRQHRQRAYGSMCGKMGRCCRCSRCSQSQRPLASPGGAPAPSAARPAARCWVQRGREERVQSDTEGTRGAGSEGTRRSGSAGCRGDAQGGFKRVRTWRTEAVGLPRPGRARARRLRHRSSLTPATPAESRGQTNRPPAHRPPARLLHQAAARPRVRRAPRRCRRRPTRRQPLARARLGRSQRPRRQAPRTRPPRRRPPRPPPPGLAERVRVRVKVTQWNCRSRRMRLR